MFRGSRILALVGIPVVAVTVALVALSADSRDPNPKGTLAIIFAVVGGFVFLLLFVQGRELRAASRASEAPTVAAGTPVENPMTTPEPDLWASLAVDPITPEAIEARTDAWGIARSSHRAGWIICLMIFTFVPAAYLLERPAIVVIGAIPIAGYALYRGLGVVGNGGDLDRGYESLARSVEPLGLVVDERPTVGVQQRMSPTPGLKTDIRGALRLSGERHGRRVSIVMADGSTIVRVIADSPEFEARSSDGKIRGGKGAVPAEIESSLRLIPGSTEWKNLNVSGGPDGIEVRRKSSGGGTHWLADLWLAERLAAAVS